MILNTSSIKKRDTMLAWTNSSPAGISEGPGAAVFVPSTTYCIVWSPTARGSSNSSGVRGSKFFEQIRTAVSTYCVGVAETIQLSTSGPTGWYWRRICFTMKGESLYVNDRGTYDLSNSPVARITSDGMKRAVLVSEAALDTRAVIFKGQQNVDWADVTLAPLDTNRIRPLYDRRVHVKSNNNAGTTMVKRIFHPMRKNLVYNEDENGEDVSESFYSVEGRAGMGDYYIVDFFQADAQGVESSVTPSNLLFEPQATFYWHER